MTRLGGQASMTVTAAHVSGASAEKLQRALREDGWAVVRSVISPVAVASARSLCDRYLVAERPEEETEIPASELAQIPELASVLLANPVVRSLELAIGGRVALYPNFVMRLNRFTDWHIDNGFLPAYHGDADHLFDPQFCHLQCVIYLQDNDAVMGGGLDVVARSHRWAEERLDPEHEVLFKRFGVGEAVDTSAGDLLMFDGRLLHRGTPAQRPAEVRKYGFFFSVSRDDEVQVARYLEYLGSRADYLRTIGLSEDYLQYMLSRYDDVRRVEYPGSFLEEAVRMFESHGVRVATIAGGTSK